MTVRTYFAAAGVAATLAAGPTLAQDFSGPYVGIGAGALVSEFSRQAGAPGPVGTWAGPMVSLSLGNDWQTGSTVYGIEADISAQYSRAKARFTFGPWEQNFGATLRARVGAVTNGTLVYGTLGYGVMHVSVPGDSDWAGGIVGGIGFESYAMAEKLGLGDGWTIEGELLYQRAKSTRLTQGGTNIFGASNSAVIRIGANHRF